MNATTLNVLLIEDDDDDIIITQRLLSQAGRQRFQVRSATCLHDAFLSIDQTPPHIILLDLSLPDSHGQETLVHTLKHAPHIPVILLTGLSDEEMGIEAVQVGAQDYLIKGQIDRDRLTRAIHYAIERKRYRDHLAEMVNERTRELQEANERLKALDQARTEFVSNVSHELKTPLASMGYAIDNLLKGIVGALPERAVSYIEMLKEDSLRLGHTVQEILDLSRIESNTLKLNRLRIPLPRLVRRTVDSLQLHASEKGLALNVSIVGAKGFADCDPQKIERLILNIIRNAVKFTPPNGTVDVALETEPHNESHFRISITDSGIGISSEHLEKVTERYFRVGEHVDGTGLGLSICKDIVELHGGRLQLLSPPPNRPNGTQVNICLPKSPPLNVLAIDDCAITLKLIAAQLCLEEYIVECCPNGAEALVHLERNVPDIIITDVVMPILDAAAMISEIKAHAHWRHIPIIAITGGVLDQTNREILEGFAIPTLQKPWQRDELFDLIESALFGMHHLNVQTARST